MRSQDERCRDLVHQLTSQPESEWVEFKENNADPERIGEYISALANSALLSGKAAGYVLWGVRDSDRAVVGTSFEPGRVKVGNEDLRNWLGRLVSPETHFKFESVELDGGTVVALSVNCADREPVRFKGVAYIRVGSYTKRLNKHVDFERRLWRALERQSFESQIAVDDLLDTEVLAALNYPAYFDLLDLPLPEDRSHILTALRSDGLIARGPTGRWSVTALGAILVAKRIEDWPTLRRKKVRLIQYAGEGRDEAVREVGVEDGYASGFQRLVQQIMEMLPANEVVRQALRQSVPMYPEVAVREIVANSLIHQDFAVAGTGPMIEIFSDRLEITNPGQPIVDPRRFLDLPPKSRNETLAALMRRMGICEERGSGWDKVATQIELHQLPAPSVVVTDEHTRVILLSPRPLSRMDRADRVRAVYLHCCLRYVTQQRMTNSSVRTRFGIEQRNSAQASRLISEALDDHMVALYDPTAGKRYTSYVPYWAATSFDGHLTPVGDEHTP